MAPSVKTLRSPVANGDGLSHAALRSAPAPEQTDDGRLAPEEAVSEGPVIHVIEDDPGVCEAIRGIFESAGWTVRDHSSVELFLAGARPSGEACLVVDVNLPGMSGIELLELLRREQSRIPVIMLTGRRDAASAVTAMKAGADDYLEKPAGPAVLLSSVTCALAQIRELRARDEARAQVKARFGNLTRREREVLDLILAGMPNKNIAADLGISQRTVETHRARVMEKTGAKSLPELVRLHLEASEAG